MSNYGKVFMNPIRKQKGESKQDFRKRIAAERARSRKVNFYQF